MSSNFPAAILNEFLLIQTQIHQDFFRNFFLILGLCMGALCLSLECYLQRINRHWIVAGIFIISGMGLSWVAMTPWLMIIGGAFVVLGSGIALREDSNIANHFIRVRAYGLLLSFVGVCALTSESSAGPILLALGGVIQLQLFPFFNLPESSSDSRFLFRIGWIQVFSGWATLAILLRVEPFPVAGWMIFLLVLLTSVFGFFQNSWILTVRQWIASGFGIGILALIFAGKEVALALAMGIGTVGIVFSAFGLMLSYRKPFSKVQIGKAFAALIGGGLFGFVSGSAVLRLLSVSSHDLSQVIFVAVSLFLLILLALKSIWMFGGEKNRGEFLNKAFRSMPRIDYFVRSGFQMGALAERMGSWIIFLGRAIHTGVDKKILDDWIPTGLLRSITAVSHGISYLNSNIDEIFNKALRKGIDTPGKFFRLIQSGNVQWYLFFVMSCAVAVWLHFLRVPS